MGTSVEPPKWSLRAPRQNLPFLQAILILVIPYNDISFKHINCSNYTSHEASSPTGFRENVFQSCFKSSFFRVTIIWKAISTMTLLLNIGTAMRVGIDHWVAYKLKLSSGSAALMQLWVTAPRYERSLLVSCHSLFFVQIGDGGQLISFMTRDIK